MPPPPPRKGLKASVYKVFILDAQGGYAGEFTVNDTCVVEFGEFLSHVPEGGLADGQTIFLNEWRATAVNGERMSLVVISRGQLGPEEVGWAKAALVGAEHQLVPTVEPEDAPVTGPNPDMAVMENLASALDKRESSLQGREKAVAEAEQRMQTAWEEYRTQFESELDGLRAKLAEAEKSRDAAKQELEAERQRMRGEMERIADVPRPAAGGPDPKIEQMKRQLEADRKYLQKYALDLISREEKVRDLDLVAADASEKLAASQKEMDALRAELSVAKEQAAQPAQPSPEMEAQRRELEMRVKILQEKAFDLLAREEKLREREQKLRDLMKQMSA